MTTLVSLAEAASYLGVSKATLRNWDKEGKLKAHRHPVNHYRAYELDDLRELKVQSSLIADPVSTDYIGTEPAVLNARSLKRVVARLHAILRDSDGDSSIIQRFDELTKLLYLKLVGDKEGVASVFEKSHEESEKTYANRLRALYKKEARRHPEIIPAQFASLKCSDNAIYGCGIHLSSISFAGTTFDLKGVAYEEMIRGTFDKGDNQQFFTPHQVVAFMVAFMKPFLRGKVGDPACGTGGFLAEVTRTNSKYQKLVGMEIDERLRWVAGINLLLHGASDFTVEYLQHGGTLGVNAKPFFGTLDAIVTNPPFGSDFNDKELQSFKLGEGRSSRRRGILFIERCWELLKDKGHLAIIIDEGVLNLPSAEDVRNFISTHFQILGIVSLPETAFMPYANVNASILYLRKTLKRTPSVSVFFAKAESIGRKSNGDDDLSYDMNGKATPNSDLPRILELWEQKVAGKISQANELAFVANVTDNLRNDPSLRLDFRYHHPSRGISRALLEDSKYPLSTLMDLCSERNDSMIPSSDTQDQIILYTGLANIESGTGVAHQTLTPAASLKSAVKRYEPMDIVFARMRPNLRKVALMTFQEGGFVSPECIVLTVRLSSDGNPVIDPGVLAAALRSDLVFGQILHLIAGIGRPRLNTSDLRKIKIPVPPVAIQKEIRNLFEGRLASVVGLQEKANALLQESQILRKGAVEDLASRLIGADKE